MHNAQIYSMKHIVSSVIGSVCLHKILVIIHVGLFIDYRPL